MPSRYARIWILKNRKMNLFDVFKNFFESDLAKGSNAVAFVGLLLFAAVAGGTIVYAYMNRFYCKKLKMDCQRLKDEKQDIESRYAELSQKYDTLEKNHDDLKKRAKEADFKKGLEAYRDAKSTMGTELSGLFSDT